MHDNVHHVFYTLEKRVMIKKNRNLETNTYMIAAQYDGQMSQSAKVFLKHLKLITSWLVLLPKIYWILLISVIAFYWRLQPSWEVFPLRKSYDVTVYRHHQADNNSLCCPPPCCYSASWVEEMIAKAGDKTKTRRVARFINDLRVVNGNGTHFITCRARVHVSVSAVDSSWDKIQWVFARDAFVGTRSNFSSTHCIPVSVLHLMPVSVSFLSTLSTS